MRETKKMNEVITKVQGFRAAHEFLNLYLEKRDTTGLRTVLSGMLLDEHGRSADQGTMYTWVEALAKDRGVDVRRYADEDVLDHPEASPEEWFVTLLGFLRYYAGTWRDDQFTHIVSDLEAVDLARGPERRNETWQAWQECCERMRGRHPETSEAGA